MNTSIEHSIEEVCSLELGKQASIFYAHYAQSSLPGVLSILLLSLEYYTNIHAAIQIQCLTILLLTPQQSPN